MLKLTCAERFTGLPIDYGLLNRLIYDAHKQRQSYFAHDLKDKRSVQFEVHMIFRSACVSHNR